MKGEVDGQRCCAFAEWDADQAAPRFKRGGDSCVVIVGQTQFPEGLQDAKRKRQPCMQSISLHTARPESPA